MYPSIIDTLDSNYKILFKAKHKSLKSCTLHNYDLYRDLPYIFTECIDIIKTILLRCEFKQS